MHSTAIKHYKNHVESNKLKIHTELYVNRHPDLITCVIEVNGVRAWYATVTLKGELVSSGHMGKAGDEIRALLSEAYRPAIIAQMGIEASFEVLTTFGEYEQNERIMKRDLVFGVCVERTEVEFMVVTDEENQVWDIICG